MEPEKQVKQRVDYGKRGKRPKSYKSCPYYPTMSKRRIRALPDEKKCKDAVNCRRCRRCPFVPQSKLGLYKKEISPLDALLDVAGKSGDPKLSEKDLSEI